MQTDMTVGKPMKMLLNFTIPVFLGNVFQQLYSMADAVIVGKFVGTKGLAAVGATGTITFLIIGFLMGITTGVTVLTSQKFGAGRMDEMRKTVGNAAILSAVIAVVMTAVSMLGMHRLLVFMHTPEDIFDGAYGYIMIICAGIFTQVLYNLVSSIFHWGAPGAAWATVISQGVSGVLCLIYMWKAVPELKMKKEDWYFNRDIAVKQISVGIPMGLQYSITAIGGMMVQSSLNILGSYAVAAFTAGSKIDNIFTQAFVAIGTTMSTYSAQNVGARKLDRVRQGFRCADVIGCAYAVVVGFVLFFVGKSFSYLFISDNAEAVIPMVDTYLRCVGMFMIPLYVVNCYRNGFQGMGYGLLPMLSGVAELIGRGVMAVVAADARSYTMACMASPFAWIVATVLLIVLYFYVMKDMKRKLCLQ